MLLSDRYSFCKAHSASFAMVSFECAWLKAQYPAYFIARVIANQGGHYDTSAYIEEARRIGVTIRGPCVVQSGWKTAGASASRLPAAKTEHAALHQKPIL